MDFGYFCGISSWSNGSIERPDMIHEHDNKLQAQKYIKNIIESMKTRISSLFNEWGSAERGTNA